jgi:hypothetical protein
MTSKPTTPIWPDYPEAPPSPDSAIRIERRGQVTTVTFGYDPAIADTIKRVVPDILRSENWISRAWLYRELRAGPARPTECRTY